MGGSTGGNFGNTRGSRSNAKIHKGRQDKHIEGTNNYNQQKANGKNPSILTSDPGNKCYNTTRATIHYDNNGNAHIVPEKPINWRK